MAKCNLSFAGQIEHFQENGTRLTKDKWELQTTLGLTINFAEIPHQKCMPNSPVFPEEEPNLLEKDILA